MINLSSKGIPPDIEIVVGHGHRFGQGEISHVSAENHVADTSGTVGDLIRVRALDYYAITMKEGNPTRGYPRMVL
jgi:hypothetical protein